MTREICEEKETPKQKCACQIKFRINALLCHGFTDIFFLLDFLLVSIYTHPRALRSLFSIQNVIFCAFIVDVVVDVSVHSFCIFN